jgi:hypothetical protein
MHAARGYEPGQSLPCIQDPSSVTLGCQIREAAAQSRATADGLGSLICGRSLAEVWTATGSSALLRVGRGVRVRASWSAFGVISSFFSHQRRKQRTFIYRERTSALVLMRASESRTLETCCVGQPCRRWRVRPVSRVWTCVFRVTGDFTGDTSFDGEVSSERARVQEERKLSQG